MSDSPPVIQESDVLAEMPLEVRSVAVAPVRDAFVTAAAAMFDAYQTAVTYAAEQSDPGRADDIYLEGLAKDHGVYKLPADSDDQLRSKLFSTPDIVSPAAILEFVNALLADHTAIQAQYLESELDGWFVGDGTEVWDSFVGSQPTNLDRLYPLDSAANSGFVRPQSNPGGTWVFADENGRMFVLRVPVLNGAVDAFAFISTADEGSFIFDGTEADPNYNTFIYANSITADETYDQIVAVTNRIKGQGIRWELYVDPGLT